MPRSELRKANKLICFVGRTEDLETLKKEKRSLKSSLTKHLNKLAVELSLEAPKKERILERLQDMYKANSEAMNVALIEEEVDGIVDRVNSVTSGARLFLAKGAAKTSDVKSNAENKSGKLESTCVKDGHVVHPNIR